MLKLVDAGKQETPRQLAISAAYALVSEFPSIEYNDFDDIPADLACEERAYDSIPIAFKRLDQN